MILKAHGDGSQNGGVVAVVTLLAEASRWDDCETRWKDTAKRAGYYPFRLSDFFVAEKDPETRKRVLTELMTILTDTAVMAAAGVMNVAPFALLPGVVAGRLGSPYHVVSNVCLAETASWIRTLKHDGLFTCVLESGDEGQGPLREALQAISRASVNVLHELGIEAVVFAPKGCAGLQMADVLAWSLSHWVPELHLDDEWGRRLHTFSAGRLCLVRRYVDREFLLEIARRNSNEYQLGLQAKYGVGLTRERNRKRQR